MHPFTRLLSLLVFAAFAPWLPGAALLAAAMLLVGVGLAHPVSGRIMWRGLRRIRWLLLSLVVLCFWFTPGTPLLPALGPWSPTDVGLLLALHQAGVLLVMVLAATVLLGGLDPRDTTAVLHKLLAGPLRTPATLRFAARVGLLLAALPDVEQQVRRNLRDGGGALADRAAALFHAVEATATQPPATVPGVALPPVPRREWLLPLGVLLAALASLFMTTVG